MDYSLCVVPLLSHKYMNRRAEGPKKTFNESLNEIRMQTAHQK